MIKRRSAFQQSFMLALPLQDSYAVDSRQRGEMPEIEKLIEHDAVEADWSATAERLRQRRDAFKTQRDDETTRILAATPTAFVPQKRRSTGDQGG
jgi:hypothetical protein